MCVCVSVCVGTYGGVYLLPVIHSYPQCADKFLVPRELGSDDRKNMPVILLHNGKHEQCFLLQGGTKLEERGLLILQRPKDQQQRQSADLSERLN